VHPSFSFFLGTRAPVAGKKGKGAAAPIERMHQDQDIVALIGQVQHLPFAPAAGQKLWIGGKVDGFGGTNVGATQDTSQDFCQRIL